MFNALTEYLDSIHARDPAPRSTLVAAETWQRDFIPYGTPCKEPCEPAEAGLQRVVELESELAALKAQVALLAGEASEAKQAPVARKRSRS